MPESKKPENEKRSEILQASLAGIAGLISFFAAIGSIFHDAGLNSDPVQQNGNIQQIETEIAQVIAEVKDLESQLGQLSEIPEESRVASEIANLNKSLDQIETRFSKIENIIVQDPSESLEIPLLQNDIQNIKEFNQSQIDTMREDIERAYTIILGTLIVLALSVLAPALTNLFANFSDKEESKK